MDTSSSWNTTLVSTLGLPSVFKFYSFAYFFFGEGGGGGRLSAFDGRKQMLFEALCTLRESCRLPCSWVAQSKKLIHL